MDNVTPDVGGALKSSVDLFLGFGSDFFAFIVLIVVVIAFAFYFGRDRLTPLIAGIYSAILLYSNFPFASYFNGNVYISVGFFILLTFLGMIAFSGLASFMSSDGVGFLKVVALAVLTAGLLMAVAIHTLPIPTIYTFSAPTLALFTSSHAFFWWLVAPVAGVFLFGK